MDADGFGRAFVAMVYFIVAVAFLAGVALASIIVLLVHWFA